MGIDHYVPYMRVLSKKQSSIKYNYSMYFVVFTEVMQKMKIFPYACTLNDSPKKNASHATLYILYT